MGLKLAGGSAPRPLPQSNCNYLFLFNYRLPMNKYILPALICFNIYCLIMFYFILFQLSYAGETPADPPAAARPFSRIQTQPTGDI